MACIINHNQCKLSGVGDRSGSPEKKNDAEKAEPTPSFDYSILGESINDICWSYQRTRLFQTWYMIRMISNIWNKWQNIFQIKSNHILKQWHTDGGRKSLPSRLTLAPLEGNNIVKWAVFHHRHCLHHCQSSSSLNWWHIVAGTTTSCLSWSWWRTWGSRRRSAARRRISSPSCSSRLPLTGWAVDLRMLSNIYHAFQPCQHFVSTLPFMFAFTFLSFSLYYLLLLYYLFYTLLFTFTFLFIFLWFLLAYYKFLLSSLFWSLNWIFTFTLRLTFT